jgi:hypothetical protein
MHHPNKKGRPNSFPTQSRTAQHVQLEAQISKYEMEKETTRHSKEQTLQASSRSPTTVNDIPDRLLKLIFRRLDSHVAYVRAAAVCTRWRSIVSTRGIFNLSYHTHDFSTTIGHYHVVDPSSSPGRRRWSSREQQPSCRVVFVPAAPSIDARHFALDFLPSCPAGRGRRQRWEVVDGCGSLLLVANQPRRGMFPDLVACEPISRRYVRIQPAEDMKHRRCLGVFLDGYRSVTSLCNFSLTCVLSEPSAGIADGVSTVTARVYRHQPPGWSRWKYGWSMPRLATSGSVHLRGVESARYAGRSKGFIFWDIQDDGTAVAAREGSCVLSSFRLPDHVRGASLSHHQSTTFRFVDDGAENDDLVRVVSLVGEDLRVFLKRDHNDSGAGIDWVPVRSLNLREATRGLPRFKECFFSQTAKVVTAGKGYIVLTPAEETWPFSIELGTMEAEREHIRNRLAGEVYPYRLHLRPRVRACVFSCKRGRWGPCYDICRCT